jgi:hypothetical protein
MTTPHTLVHQLARWASVTPDKNALFEKVGGE